jgi:hypothetical protein
MQLDLLKIFGQKIIKNDMKVKIMGRSNFVGAFDQKLIKIDIKIGIIGSSIRHHR